MTLRIPNRPEDTSLFGSSFFSPRNNSNSTNSSNIDSDIDIKRKNIMNLNPFQTGLFVMILACVTLYNSPKQLQQLQQLQGQQEQTPHSHRPHQFGLGIAERNFNFTTTYEPCDMERWLIHGQNGRKFNFDKRTRARAQMADGCKMYRDQNATPYYDQLQVFRSELHEYATILDRFLRRSDNDSKSETENNQNEHSISKDQSQGQDQQLSQSQSRIPHDLRKQIAAEQSYDICTSLELHPDGLPGIFSKSGMLSKVPGGGGYLEPLLTPLRHLDHCYVDLEPNHPRYPDQYVMDMHYLVHDFASLCRKLKPTGRNIFLDMGAALDFHDNSNLAPAVYVTEVYQKFGFHFDHIYAYEVVSKEPNDVYRRVPDELRAAYHWFNVGVNATISSSHNPLKLLLENYDEDDFIVVKLDIDTPAIEQPMVQLILNDERLQKIIDCFYFEHHVFLRELAPYWRSSMGDTVENSLQLFTTLREKGIAAHYWP